MISYFNKGVCVCLCVCVCVFERERERQTDRQKSKSKTARDVAKVAEGEDRKYDGSSFVALILGGWQDIQRMNSK